MVTKSKKYEELYKKYRPRTWSDVIGQDSLVTNLSESVASDRLPSAYLFSGPRGCGKTTVALILAKAMNCENPDGQGNPCNHCPTCLSIDRGNCIGVHYISAVNLKNGATDIREIVDKAKRRSMIHRPVWIIDEIQRLSVQSLDAFLIPLEDTNLPSMFIFCTTEIDKIPLTITSRVQQRAFKLLSKNKLITLCESVLTQEQYECIDEADRKAIEAEDSTKDLDQRRKVYSKELIYKAVKDAGTTFEGGSARQVLSELDHLLSSPTSSKHDWTRAIATDLFLDTPRNPCGNVKQALTDVSQAIQDDADVKILLRSLVDFIREMILITNLDDTSSYPRKRVETANRLGDVVLLKCFRIIGKAQRDSNFDSDARVYLEVALVELSIILQQRMEEIAA